MTAPLCSTVILRIAAWICLGFVALVSVAPLALRPQIFAEPNIERLGAFALLSLLFCLSYPQRLVAMTFLMISTAALLELAQTFTVDRHGRLSDMVVKMAGALLGVVVARVMIRAATRARLS